MLHAYLMFKSHPKFSKIKFVVEPDLRPRLERPCDIPLPMKETMAEYGQLFGGQIDFSLLEKMANTNRTWKELWFLHNQDPLTKEKLLKAV